MMGQSESTLDLVDAHCHIDLFGSNERDVIDSIQQQRIHTLAVTNAPSVFFHTQDIAKNNRFVYAAVGLHPELVKSHDHELDAMWPLMAETRFVGEIGLDYVTTDEAIRRRQRNAFAKILSKCADAKNKVISVHSRRSASDVIAAVGPEFPGTVILHWFTGTLREAERAVQIGCWFSINPAMVCSVSGRRVISVLPQDRVLTESDGPFVKIGGRPARPAQVIDAVRYLSDAWREPVEITARRVMDSFLHAIAEPK